MSEKLDLNIISDGTLNGTKVINMATGKSIINVQKIEIIIDATVKPRLSFAICNITFYDVKINYTGEGEYFVIPDKTKEK